jgi:hypothetical protein
VEFLLPFITGLDHVKLIFREGRLRMTVCGALIYVFFIFIEVSNGITLIASANM